MLASEAARQHGTTGSTQDERARAWRRWNSFLTTMEIQDDPFLTKFEPWTRTLLICAFAQAMREATFSKGNVNSLAEGTIRTTIDYVAQTFRADNRPDPKVDDGGRLSCILQQQYKGYKNLDGNTKQQKALPLIVLRELAKNKSTVENLALAQLVIGAFFFAMRSCEYLRTNIPEEKRRTKTLCIRNLRFFIKGCLLAYCAANLILADTITVTFEFQKSDERHESVTMFRSGDPTLCPVRAYAAIVKRILSYPNTDYDTTINTIYVKGALQTITSTTARNKLRSAARNIGPVKLGFKPEDIGTHSVRSGAAMAMYLDAVPTFSIMMIGRWSSDAFLKYIRKQVEQFSHNVSSRMLRHESFFTTPDFQPTTSRHDTRMPNDPRNFATNNYGGVAARRERFAICD